MIATLRLYDLRLYDWLTPPRFRGLALALMQTGMARHAQHDATEQRPVQTTTVMQFQPLASSTLLAAIMRAHKRRLAHGGLKFPATVVMSH
jgi:hypothetical protein